jgi:hypothetical protein
MPQTGHIEETPSEDGSTVEKLHVEFSNGSLEQLRNLGKYFGVESDDPSEVVTLGISFLQNIKDRSDSADKPPVAKKG